MKDFKSIVVVTHPLDLVWKTIRDRLPELVLLLDDIEQVTVVERQEEADGTVKLVNLWKAKPQIPSMLSSAINPAMFAWTDHAQWMPHAHECRWRIEPQFLAERTRCTGTTRYETAMAGRGTKITFGGEFDIAAHGLAGVPSFLDGTISKAIESFVTSLIPRNFRKLAQATGTFLDGNK
jgi:hypothetical protein